MSPLKCLLIDAVVGRGFPSVTLAGHYTRASLAIFDGNQHNEHWSWSRDALDKLELTELDELYASLL